MATTFRVYSIRSKGDIDVPTQGGLDRKSFYGLIHEREFDSEQDAKDWIDEDGRNGVDYTILTVIRK